MKVLVIGQGIAGTALGWELSRRGIDFAIVDRPVGETASRVAAGLVNPLTGRAFKTGWRQDDCLPAADAFYRETEKKLGGTWWQQTPIFRELANDDQIEIWRERQMDETSAAYAGPLFPWPSGWQGKGQAGYTRGAAVLHVESLVNSAREYWKTTGTFIEDNVIPNEIEGKAGMFDWKGSSFSHIVWCTGWEAGQHPAMPPLKGRPSKGTIIDISLPAIDWDAGVLHFGHWLVKHAGFWRFGATYAWSWVDPGVAEMPAIHELMHDLLQRYQGNYEIMRARAAIRPIVRRSQPVAGPIPGLDGQYVFSALGSKGVTTAPWTAVALAEHLVQDKPLPEDLLPSALWK